MPRIEWVDAESRTTPAPAALERLEPHVGRAMSEGRPVLFSDMDGGAMAYAQILPLIVQGVAQGVVVLGTREPRVTVNPLVADFVGRASGALESVMLMEQIREADRRKDEFLGMLAHELRNPLGPIYNCLQLQKLLPPGDARVGPIRETLDRQVKHMSRLIDDLLDATRLAHGKILLRAERCDIVSIVRQTVEDYRNIVDAGGLTLSLDLPDHPIWIDGDPTRLLQVVGNLLHNANKFSNPRGLIRVAVRETGGSEEGGFAAVSVADSGIGIDPAMLGHVFDVFRQADQGLDRSRGGLGLGLALVKGLVQLHMGTVEALSDGPNRGAEFRIRLPLAAGAATPAVDGPAMAQAVPLRILLIEDNVDAAESARMLLRHEGHEVETAFDAETGLAAARRFAPDVILCDIGLPGMDGYQIIRKIREDAELSPIYVVALTGYGREADRNQALASGFDLHLTKPIDWPTLAATLQRARPGQARKSVVVA
jgi:signal transduction histidine kinase/ActR/RegA family two-component response regulator